MYLGGGKWGNNLLSSILKANTEMCFAYPLEKLENHAIYELELKTDETIQKKPKLYKKGNRPLLGSTISNVYIAMNTVNAD